MNPEPSDSGKTQPASEQHETRSLPARSLSVWERLKDHKIAQWTLAYAAAGYALLHGTEMVSNALEWPHLIVRILTLLLLLGLPVVVTLAWYQGHRAQRRVSGAELTIITVLLILAGTALWYFARPSQEKQAAEATMVARAPTTTRSVQPAAPPPSPKSIAVLPFTDMSEKKDQEYFADGMSEEIINLLVQAPELFVPARTSSFFFKGKQVQIPEIARALHVAHVLEGSVRKAGNQLRLTAQLIRAADGYHVWSQTYDRDFRDVFKVQDEVANAVVQALRISLMGGALTRQKGGTENLEAYQLYLRARSAALDHTKESLEAEGKYLNKAIELDPNFALGWLRLADFAIGQTEAGLVPPKEGWERARHLTQHAVQLAPDLSSAHSILGWISRTYDWDWATAAAEFRRTLSMDPNNVGALYGVGMLSGTLGRWDDAVHEMRLAVARDPLDTFAILNLGIVLYGAGRFAEADATYRKVIDLAPDFLWVHYYLGKTLLAEGKPEAALAMVQQDKDEEDRMLILPIVLQAAGHKAEADEALKTFITKFGQNQPYCVAMNYAYRNQPDLALHWLELAYHQRSVDLAEILGEHLFKNIADDPRYKAFLRKMNLPV